jgi:hypothetical protein
MREQRTRRGGPAGSGWLSIAGDPSSDR